MDGAGEGRVCRPASGSAWVAQPMGVRGAAHVAGFVQAPYAPKPLLSQKYVLRASRRLCCSMSHPRRRRMRNAFDTVRRGRPDATSRSAPVMGWRCCKAWRTMRTDRERSKSEEGAAAGVATGSPAGTGPARPTKNADEDPVTKPDPGEGLAMEVKPEGGSGDGGSGVDWSAMGTGRRARRVARPSGGGRAFDGDNAARGTDMSWLGTRGDGEPESGGGPAFASCRRTIGTTLGGASRRKRLSPATAS